MCRCGPPNRNVAIPPAGMLVLLAYTRRLLVVVGVVVGDDARLLINSGCGA